MIRLDESLSAARDGGRKLLVPYMTGGLGPDWLDVVRAMAAAGADAVEIGLPFSDPSMDGPVIQEASQAALDGGATPMGIIGSLRDADVSIPLVVMTYYNVVFRSGLDRFASKLVDSGVTGAIIPDLPLEEMDDWAAAADEAEIETVLLASPVTPDDRLVRICERTRGYVYGVSVMGVTGERMQVAESAATMARRLKAVTDKPVLVGFGVSTPAQAVEVCRHADGVIIGTALVRRVLDGGGAEAAGDAVAAVRAALDAG